MAAPDYASMSNDELIAALPPRTPNSATPGVGAPVPQAAAPAASPPAATGRPDYSKMSNEELLAGLKPRSPQPQEASFADKAMRGIGLGTRAVVQGLTAVPGMVTDNLIAKPLNAAADVVMGEGNGPRLQMLKEATGNLATHAGLPKPETASERIAQDVVEGASGAVAGLGAGAVLSKAASPITAGVGEMMSQAPVMQAVSGATSGAASGVTRENGGGAGAQLVAGLLGGLAPTVGGFAAKEGMRRVIRGGEEGRQQMADNIATFESAAGITPTLGQATQSRAIQAAETGLSSVPGSAGFMARRGEVQAKALQDSVQEITDKLSPNANGWGAGEAIAKGVEVFKNNVRTVQKHLYGKLDEHIPAGTMIASDRTKAALADLNAGIDGAPALSAWFKNARIQGIEGGLKRDTTDLEAILSRPGVQQQASELRGRLQAQAARIDEQNAERSMLGMNNLQPRLTPEQIEARVQGMLTSKVDGQLPYESLKKLRTLVGQEISDGGLVADVPKSKWRALYAALSDDLGTAAEQAGPAAQQAWSRANQYTKASIQRLEQLESVVNRDAPEKIFKAATSGLSDGGTQIQRLMKSMPVSNRREVTAAVLQRLGRARNSAQNEMGEAFSPETFLTNLAAMSPPARDALFANSGFPGLRKRIEVMGQMAALRRDGAQVFANPSGTARQTSLIGMGSGIAGALASGNIPMLMGIAATPLAARVGAAITTNPTHVRWAAERTVANPATQAAALNTAVQSAQAEPQVFTNKTRASMEASRLRMKTVEVPGGWVLVNR